MAIASLHSPIPQFERFSAVGALLAADAIVKGTTTV